MKLHFTLVALVSGWGGEGHRIVADLALRLIDHKTMGYLQSHLGTIGEKTMAKVSTWADSEDAISRYPNSASYHFSNTPYRDCSPFVMHRDCGRGGRRGICIVTALADSIQASFDIDASVADRTDALKFLIHLMADIHQPLHTGFREDTGGLRINLGSPSGLNLHDIWDNWMIENFKQSLSSRARQATAKNIVDNLLEEIDRDAHFVGGNLTVIFESINNTIKFTSEIASETVMETTCKFAYRDVSGEFLGVGDEIGRAYFETRLIILKTQLKKAAIRLALVLDEVANAFHTNRVARKEAARAGRIARLFEARESEVTASLATSNRFSDLEIDFNPDELLERNFACAAPTRPVTADIRKRDKAKKVDESTLLEEAIAFANRGSYIFNGIDLLSLVMRQTGENHMYISTKQVMGNSKRRLAPEASIVTSITFAAKQSFQFAFDYNAFSRKILTDELAVRIILYIRGIDPRIDVSDYLGGDMGDFKLDRLVIDRADPLHAVTLVRRQESHDRQRGLAERLALLAARGIRESMTTQLELLKNEICFFRVGSQRTILILPSTMRSLSNLIRLHSISTQRTIPVGYMRSERIEHTYLIDPEIFAGPVDTKERREFAKLLDYIISRNGPMSEVQSVWRPSWMQVMKELEMSFRPTELRDPDFVFYRISDILIYEADQMGTFKVMDIETRNITSTV